MDSDPLHVRWEFSDGTTQEYEDLGQPPYPNYTRRYPRPGRYVERLSVADPTGRAVDTQIVIRVRTQRMLRLAVVPARLRARRWPKPSHPASEIRFQTTVPNERVYFRVERGFARRRGHGLRWRRTPGRFAWTAWAGPGTAGFDGWVGDRRLRPGRYRLVAAPHGVQPLRALFRIVR